MFLSNLTFFRLCILAFVLGVTSLQAQNEIPAALKQAENDLKQAIADLEKTRQAIATEKPKLTEDFRKIEKDLLEKRRLVRIARLSKDDRAQELRQLQTDLSTRRQDANYLSSLLKDHALKTTTLSSPGSPNLKINPTIIAAEMDNPSSSLQERLAILDASVTHLEQLLGGSTAPGKAADPSGNIAEGTFAAVGPVSYFLSENKTSGGDVIPSKTGEIPHYIPGNESNVSALISGTSTTLPLDPTGGNARAMDEIDGGFIDMVNKGGLWVWPIMFLA
ncbi:MAG: hypothetical protein ACK57Z_01710, partial [Akkermansiaceae bacterium]